ncbi:DUF4249 domain-containing protein [Fulvivirga sediminis]|uniref:DUF4249 domain-containing protein n=1 Tax=Fulvivirga sediminis TaxID=2803949 RepID=A0A937F5Y4_9BACT|nr:DUF4249 domain-containing protein [Fulvivirga sediminis]MBL3655259.1 DUF4249 domain-containing protein [Fulvivirga sediminis]
MTRQLYTFILLAIVGLNLIGCDEPYQIDEQTTEPKVVIEGLVTNESKRHYVRVTKTVDFYSEKGSVPVYNASVMVSDNQGNTYNYSYQANTEGGGYYYSDDIFAGEVGVAYTLNVALDGEEYSGRDSLRRVTPIDSLGVRFDQEEFDDPEDEGRYYEVLLYIHEPQETEDYYLFRYYLNGSTFKDETSDIYVSDDSFLGENIDGLATPGWFALNDSVTVEMYSLTLTGYKYYADLNNLLNNDGGFFGSPPVNPQTNISNGAMGFFQVSSVVRKSVIIED